MLLVIYRIPSSLKKYLLNFNITSKSLRLLIMKSTGIAYFSALKIFLNYYSIGS